MKEFFTSSNFLIVLGISLVLFIFIRIAKSVLQNKMVDSFTNQDFDTYFKTIDSLLSKYIFPRAQREFLKMNAYMAQGKTEALLEQLDYFEQRRMQPKLLTEICIRLFNYFLGIRHEEGTKRSLELLEAVIGVDNARRNREMYDIYIKESPEHLEAMHAEYQELLNDEEADAMLLCQLEVMLGYQYYYKGERELAKEMFDKGIEHADSDLYKEGLRLVIKDFKL